MDKGNTQQSTSLHFAFPPLDEQSSRSLPVSSTGRRRRLTRWSADQRRLIDLLKEKRQAVISHAVTKGLNPDAPMKPSGIEWLGDVPKH